MICANSLATMMCVRWWNCNFSTKIPPHTAVGTQYHRLFLQRTMLRSMVSAEVSRILFSEATEPNPHISAYCRLLLKIKRVHFYLTFKTYGITTNIFVIDASTEPHFYNFCSMLYIFEYLSFKYHRSNFLQCFRCKFSNFLQHLQGNFSNFLQEKR